MTGKELKAFFKDHLVPGKLYKIGGEHDKRVCMEKDKDGWSVFFCEKKQKIGLMRYKDESSACRAMKEELRKIMELMYGVTWVAE